MNRTVAFVLSLFLIGCAAPTIKTTKQLNIDSLGVVAVLPFAGHHGDQFADSVAQELLLRGVRIAERSRITSVLIGQGLSMADITSGQINYEQIGGLLGKTRLKKLIVGNLGEMSAQPGAVNAQMQASKQLSSTE